MDELNRLSTEEFKTSKKNNFIIILDNIRSMHNIGSVFRTSDAFAVSELILCGICAQPPHRDIEKSALGATESVDWKYFKETSDAINYAKSLGYRIISIEQTEKSIPLNEFNFKVEEKYAFVYGNEVEGVQQEIINSSDNCIEIPQFGTKHSFNVSVTAGIVMWHAFNHMLV